MCADEPPAKHPLALPNSPQIPSQNTNNPSLPPKPDKTQAIQIVSNIYKGNATGFCLITFQKFREHNRTRSDAYNGFSFLCYANTCQEAGWLVCRYAEKGTCQLSTALRPFNSKTGGTGTLKSHTEDHERSGKRNILGFPFKLQKTEKTKIVRAAAKACVLSGLPFSFSESQGMLHFAKSLFNAGQGCAPGTNVDVHDLMPSRTAVRDEVQKLAIKVRSEFVEKDLKSVLEYGGGVTCDGLKQKINGTKFYDLIIHYINPGVEHPSEGHQCFQLVSRVLLLQENRIGESAAEINHVLERGMQSHYGITFSRLMDANFTFVTDCAANMPRVVGRSTSSSLVPFGDRWLGCICHQLNTAMKHVVEEDLRNCGLVHKNFLLVKKIVSYFKVSNSNQFLAEGFKLIQDVETRFGTVHDVIVRFLRAANHVRALVSGGTATAVVPMIEDLTKEETTRGVVYPALEAVVSSFGPLREIQTRLEASETPTMHLVIPMLEHAKKTLTAISNGRMVTSQAHNLHPVEMEFAKMVLSHVNEIELQPLWVVGCLLHPCLRELSSVWDMSRRREYRHKGLTKLREMISSKKAVEGPVQIEEESCERDGRRNRLLEPQFGVGGFNLEEHIDIGGGDLMVEQDELSRYMEHRFTREEMNAAMEKDFGVIKFWLANKRTFPILYGIALRVYAVPVSSTPSERNFSHVNRIVTSERSRLTPDIVEDIVCANSFLKK